MRIIFGFILFLGLICPVFASQNVLSGVEISNLNGKYSIVLNAGQANYRKLIKNNNNIVIELKNVVQADKISTSYIDAPTIDSVTVQTLGNKTRLNIKGKDVADAEVTFLSGANAENIIYQKQKNLPFDPLFALGVLIIAGSVFLLKNSFRIVPKNRILAEQKVFNSQPNLPPFALNNPKIVPYARSKSEGSKKSQYATNAVDSIKFLETVTQIYESKGRKDLAQNVKSGLDKIKIAI